MYKVLKNKRAIITGANGGLGKELVNELKSHECEVIPIARQYGDLTELKTINKIKSKYNSIDILINCAGSFLIKSILETNLEEYENMFNINVKVPFMLSKVFAPDMIKNKWGRIVNIGSSSAYNGGSDTGLYCMTKHALLGMSKSLYAELKDHGVRVHNVSPGSIQTKMGASDYRQDFSTFINPKEIASYIAFIISFDSEMVVEESRLNRVFV
ncbi:MAG TPA: SDR family oxidoreductase [Bacteroidales bacterium]|nr:SDR family oxidoreductase [Bacteroidales bacterium]